VGVRSMMRGSDYPHSESTFPQSRKIPAEILEGVPGDEPAKPTPDHHDRGAPPLRHPPGPAMIGTDGDLRR